MYTEKTTYLCHHCDTGMTLDHKLSLDTRKETGEGWSYLSCEECGDTIYVKGFNKHVQKCVSTLLFNQGVHEANMANKY